MLSHANRSNNQSHSVCKMQLLIGYNPESRNMECKISIVINFDLKIELFIWVFPMHFHSIDSST